MCFFIFYSCHGIIYQNIFLVIHYNILLSYCRNFETPYGSGVEKMCSLLFEAKEENCEDGDNGTVEIDQQVLDNAFACIEKSIEFLRPDGAQTEWFPGLLTKPNIKQYVVKRFEKMLSKLPKVNFVSGNESEYKDTCEVKHAKAFVLRQDQGFGDTIYICNIFFNKDEKEQVGYIIHELAHLVEYDVIDRTYDRYVGCKRLRSGEARTNASNYQFFAMSFYDAVVQGHDEL